jgi:hypothetical protein
VAGFADGIQGVSVKDAFTGISSRFASNTVSFLQDITERVKAINKVAIENNFFMFKKF